MAVLVFAEHDNAELNVATLHAVAAASQIDSDGNGIHDNCEEKSSVCGGSYTTINQILCRERNI